MCNSGGQCYHVWVMHWLRLRWAEQQYKTLGRNCAYSSYKHSMARKYHNFLSMARKYHNFWQSYVEIGCMNRECLVSSPWCMWQLMFQCIDILVVNCGRCSSETFQDTNRLFTGNEKSLPVFSSVWKNNYSIVYICVCVCIRSVNMLVFYSVEVSVVSKYLN